jgi:hypothetical protein
MPAYKFVDGNKDISFIYPYQDIMVSMTDALKEGDILAYIDLVKHFRNMSLLAFNDKDFSNLERIDTIIAIFQKYISKASFNKMNTAELYSIENVNHAYEKNYEFKIICEYRFSGVMERICIAALRKTVFKDQLPEAQNSIYYDPSRDIELTIKNFNSILEENDILGLEI